MKREAEISKEETYDFEQIGRELDELFPFGDEVADCECEFGMENMETFLDNEIKTIGFITLNNGNADVAFTEVNDLDMFEVTGVTKRYTKGNTYYDYCGLYIKIPNTFPKEVETLHNGKIVEFYLTSVGGKTERYLMRNPYTATVTSQGGLKIVSMPWGNKFEGTELRDEFSTLIADDEYEDHKEILKENKEKLKAFLGEIKMCTSNSKERLTKERLIIFATLVDRACGGKYGVARYTYNYDTSGKILNDRIEKLKLKDCVVDKEQKDITLLDNIIITVCGPLINKKTADLKQFSLFKEILW